MTSQATRATLYLKTSILENLIYKAWILDQITPFASISWKIQFRKLAFVSCTVELMLCGVSGHLNGVPAVPDVSRKVQKCRQRLDPENASLKRMGAVIALHLRTKQMQTMSQSLKKNNTATTCQIAQVRWSFGSWLCFFHKPRKTLFGVFRGFPKEYIYGCFVTILSILVVNNKSGHNRVVRRLDKNCKNNFTHLQQKWPNKRKRLLWPLNALNTASIANTVQCHN